MLGNVDGRRRSQGPGLPPPIRVGVNNGDRRFSRLQTLHFVVVVWGFLAVLFCVYTIMRAFSARNSRKKPLTKRTFAAVHT